MREIARCLCTVSLCVCQCLICLTDLNWWFHREHLCSPEPNGIILVFPVVDSCSRLFLENLAMRAFRGAFMCQIGEPFWLKLIVKLHFLGLFQEGFTFKWVFKNWVRSALMTRERFRSTNNPFGSMIGSIIVWCWPAYSLNSRNEKNNNYPVECFAEVLSEDQ